MGQNPKRHCWECRRRCLVCDSTRPACNRCTAAGAPCPGYGDVKPTRLVWLAPGTVKSRVRKRKPSLPPEPNEPHIHGQSLVPATQLRQRATVVPRPHANDISIPRFGIYTDADAVVHSAKYCKLLLIQPMKMPNADWVRSNSQRLYLSRYLPSPGTREQSRYISNITRAYSGSHCSPRLHAALDALHGP